MSDSVFVLSIEPEIGESYIYGFHLGTIEDIARMEAELIWSRKHDLRGRCKTVALVRDRRIFDVYDGTTWFNAAMDKWYEESAVEAIK